MLYFHAVHACSFSSSCNPTWFENRCFTPWGYRSHSESMESATCQYFEEQRSIQLFSPTFSSPSLNLLCQVDLAIWFLGSCFSLTIYWPLYVNLLVGKVDKLTFCPCISQNSLRPSCSRAFHVVQSLSYQWTLLRARTNLIAENGDVVKFRDVPYLLKRSTLYSISCSAIFIPFSISSELGAAILAYTVLAV